MPNQYREMWKAVKALSIVINFFKKSVWSYSVFFEKIFWRSALSNDILAFLIIFTLSTLDAVYPLEPPLFNVF